MIAMAFPSFSFAVLLLSLLAHSFFFTPSLATLHASTAARSKASSSLSVRDGEHPCVEFFQISDRVYSFFLLLSGALTDNIRNGIPCRGCLQMSNKRTVR